MSIRYYFPIFILILLTGCQSLEDSPEDINQGDIQRESDSVRGSPKALDPGDSDAIRSQHSGKKPAKAQVYQIKPNKPLDLPPELIASTSDDVLQNIEESNNSVENILPEVIGSRIVKDGNERWLEIDTSAEIAWKSVTQYWSLGGVNLVDYNPEAGLMETQWIEQPSDVDEDQNAFIEVTKQLITSFTKADSALDKYRLRFERLSSNETALYVSHRSIARKEIAYSKKISEFEWVELPSDPEKEAELLQILILLFNQSESPT